ncbi:hypothetical protein CEXT_668251 [Caerostris extrusa]|uniref:Uncharacterized protein n=1 Tax=Caerostris extrusa TaxID=172846 RepID=A0AAV4Q535_CAEEX|nr:hypothetical protein CEXT_668251 [Caerostris extrusa]
MYALSRNQRLCGETQALWCLWNAERTIDINQWRRNSDETKTSPVSRLDTKAPLACNVPIIGFVAYTSLPAEPHNPLSLTTISFYASLTQIKNAKGPLILINGVRNSDETKTSPVSRLDTKAPLACNVPILGFVAYPCRAT